MLITYDTFGALWTLGFVHWWKAKLGHAGMPMWWLVHQVVVVVVVVVVVIIVMVLAVAYTHYYYSINYGIAMAW